MLIDSGDEEYVDECELSDDNSVFEIKQQKKIRKVKTRPGIVTTRNPEKQHFTENYKNKKSNNQKPFILVVGDSMIKNVNSYDLKQNCTETTFMVRSLRGGKIKNIKNLIIDTLEDVDKPDALCIHVSSNDIGNGRSIEEIGTDMEYLITLVKRQGIEPILSMVVTRNDKYADKVRLVNERLRDLCVSYNIGYIEHANIKIEHLNTGGIHIQNQFNNMFADNLTNYFNFVLQRGIISQ